MGPDEADADEGDFVEGGAVFGSKETAEESAVGAREEPREVGKGSVDPLDPRRERRDESLARGVIRLGDELGVVKGEREVGVANPSNSMVSPVRSIARDVSATAGFSDTTSPCPLGCMLAGPVGEVRGGGSDEETKSPGDASERGGKVVVGGLTGLDGGDVVMRWIIEG